MVKSCQLISCIAHKGMLTPFLLLESFKLVSFKDCLKLLQDFSEGGEITSSDFIAQTRVCQKQPLIWISDVQGVGEHIYNAVHKHSLFLTSLAQIWCQPRITLFKLDRITWHSSKRPLTHIPERKQHKAGLAKVAKQRIPCKTYTFCLLSQNVKLIPKKKYFLREQPKLID